MMGSSRIHNGPTLSKKRTIILNTAAGRLQLEA